MLSWANNMTSDLSHISFENYQLLPSNKRFRVPQVRLSFLRSDVINVGDSDECYSMRGVR